MESLNSRFLRGSPTVKQFTTLYTSACILMCPVGFISLEIPKYDTYLWDLDQECEVKRNLRTRKKAHRSNY